MLNKLKGLSDRFDLGYAITRTLRRYGYLVFGVILGWGLCHYYVELYNGVFPNVSIITFVFELLEVRVAKVIGLLSMIVGTVIVPLVTTYLKLKKETK